MNDDDRAAVAARVRAERLRRFGTKLGAYSAAKVNAATWDRIEAGQSVRPYKMAAVVRALWPSTGGDWTRIPDDETPPDLPTVDERLAAIEQRLAAIEHHITRRESESGDGHDPAPTTTAASAAADQHVTGRSHGLPEPQPGPNEPSTVETPRPGQHG